MRTSLLAAMTLKALAIGSEVPKSTGKLRLYSMRFCPYAERTLLTLNAKKIDYEIVNVNLRDKPQWLFEKNPFGKIPALEFGDKILVESLIICDYLDEVHKETPLRPSDPYERARDRVLLELFAKVTQKFVSLALSKDPSTNRKELWEEILKELQFWEKELGKRGTPYFCGEKAAMLDYMLWPWFERLPVVTTMHSLTPVTEIQSLSGINGWISRMKQDPVIQQTVLPIEYHIQFTQSIVDGKTNYDIGL